MEPEWLSRIGPLVLLSKCYGKQSTRTSVFRQKRKIRLKVTFLKPPESLT